MSGATFARTCQWKGRPHSFTLGGKQLSTSREVPEMHLYPEAAWSATAGLPHGGRQGGGEAHGLDRLSCLELICIVFVFLLFVLSTTCSKCKRTIQIMGQSAIHLVDLNLEQAFACVSS